MYGVLSRICIRIGSKTTLMLFWTMFSGFPPILGGRSGSATSGTRLRRKFYDEGTPSEQGASSLSHASGSIEDLRVFPGSLPHTAKTPSTRIHYRSFPLVPR